MYTDNDEYNLPRGRKKERPENITSVAKRGKVRWKSSSSTFPLLRYLCINSPTLHPSSSGKTASPASLRCDFKMSLIGWFHVSERRPRGSDGSRPLHTLQMRWESSFPRHKMNGQGQPGKESSEWESCRLSLTFWILQKNDSCGHSSVPAQPAGVTRVPLRAVDAWWGLSGGDFCYFARDRRLQSDK